MKLTRRRANVLSFIVFIVLLLPLVFVGILTAQSYDTHRYKGWVQMPAEDYLVYLDKFYAVLGHNGSIDKVEDTHYDVNVTVEYDFHVQNGWKEDKVLQVLSLEEWGRSLQRVEIETHKKALPYVLSFLILVEVALYIFILKTPKSRIRIEVLDGEDYVPLKEYMNKKEEDENRDQP